MSNPGLLFFPKAELSKKIYIYLYIYTDIYIDIYGDDDMKRSIAFCFVLFLFSL